MMKVMILNIKLFVNNILSSLEKVDNMSTWGGV